MTEWGHSAAVGVGTVPSTLPQLTKVEENPASREGHEGEGGGAGVSAIRQRGSRETQGKASS